MCTLTLMDLVYSKVSLKMKTFMKTSNVDDDLVEENYKEKRVVLSIPSFFWVRDTDGEVWESTFPH